MRLAWGVLCLAGSRVLQDEAQGRVFAQGMQILQGMGKASHETAAPLDTLGAGKQTENLDGHHGHLTQALLKSAALETWPKAECVAKCPWTWWMLWGTPEG
jgi:hypothetical protein